MGTMAKVELSDKQATQLAYALYPAVMEHCKKTMEQPRSQDRRGDCNEKENK